MDAAFFTWGNVGEATRASNRKLEDRKSNRRAGCLASSMTKHRRENLTRGGHGAAIFSHMAMGPGDAAGMGPGDAAGRKVPGQLSIIKNKTSRCSKKTFCKHRREKLTRGGHGAAVFSPLAMGPGDVAGMGPGDAAAATSRIVAASTAAPRIHVI